jgi:hypothetical protein
VCLVRPLHTKPKPQTTAPRRARATASGSSLCFRGALPLPVLTGMIFDGHAGNSSMEVEVWIKMDTQSRRDDKIWTSSSKSQLTASLCTAQWQRRPEAPMRNSMQLAAGWKYPSIYCHYSWRVRYGLSTGSFRVTLAQRIQFCERTRWRYA